MPSERPVIVGVGQVTNKTDGLARAREPLALMEEAARTRRARRRHERAAREGRFAPGCEHRVVAERRPAGGPRRAHRRLAVRAHLHDAGRQHAAVAGQRDRGTHRDRSRAVGADRRGRGAAQRAARSKARAEARLVAARPAGAERGRQPPWLERDGDKHGAFAPIQVYPLFENALRAKHGHSIAEHQREVGELCERFSSVAARHPNAWFPEARSAEEIATPGPANRMVGFPYPKFMNAIMEVDQGAALLMTSESHARELGIPEDRWVYHLGGGEAFDHWFFTERVNYHSSPAIGIAGRRALETAGVGHR